MDVNAYLYYDGHCRQAVELYGRALSAEVLHLSLFSDAPDFLKIPGREDLVFHCTLRIGETCLNLSDDPSREKCGFDGFALLVHMDSAEAVDRAAKILAENGRMLVSAQEVAWAERYAIAVDQFGVTWKLQFSH